MVMIDHLIESLTFIHLLIVIAGPSKFKKKNAMENAKKDVHIKSVLTVGCVSVEWGCLFTNTCQCTNTIMYTCTKEREKKNFSALQILPKLNFITRILFTRCVHLIEGACK